MCSVVNATKTPHTAATAGHGSQSRNQAMNTDEPITPKRNKAIDYSSISDVEINRFWSRVSIGSPTDCWEWTGAKTGFGYGHMGISGRRQVYAHRLSYVIHNGPIPPGMHVCHSCDNPKCVNPGHLWVGTAQDNAIDRDAKGRHPSKVGSECGAAKLTESDVTNIRERAKSRKLGDINSMAREFGVTRGTIYTVIARLTWTHID